MKKYSLLVLCFLLTLICPSLSQASELTTPNVLKQITKKGQLRIGVKQDVPNFGYYHPKHRQFEGMEIDIAKKLLKLWTLNLNLLLLLLKLEKPY